MNAVLVKLGAGRETSRALVHLLGVDGALQLARCITEESLVVWFDEHQPDPVVEPESMT